AYVQGISTRSVDDLVKALGLEGISKSEVSRLCADLDVKVNTFLDRPIEGDWPYVWIDATYVKCREDHHIRSTAVIIAVGVSADGHREVLGMATGPSEAEPFWTEFLRGLKRRGLRGTKLVISDSHEGLKKAAAKVLACTWQRCRVHFMRNAMAHVGPSQRPMVIALLKTIFVEETLEAAKARWREVTDRLREKFSRLAAMMDQAEDDVLAYMAFPKAHWTKIYSTNPIERLNAEVKRRTDVVGIFPNSSALVRLVGAILMEQSDEWLIQRRYMPLEGLAAISDNPDRLLPVGAV
ncbi:MAG: IS256 family transposase, partial [Alphaproteobacteria bacterium]|nr:IS256 family transposase [Alphaproteobacteria bacterium]